MMLHRRSFKYAFRRGEAELFWFERVPISSACQDRAEGRTMKLEEIKRG
jgi:hypothetical protein